MEPHLAALFSWAPHLEGLYFTAYRMAIFMALHLLA